MRWREIAVSLLALSGSACAHHVAVGAPVVAATPSAATPLSVRGAVLSGLSARRFAIESEQAGVVNAHLDRRRQSIRLRVLYAADRYAIEYVDSLGLGAHTDEGGAVRISATYHRHVERLRDAIDAALAQPPGPVTGLAAGAPPPAYGGAAQPGSGAASALGGQPVAAGQPTFLEAAPPPPSGPPAVAVPSLNPEAPAEPEPRYVTHPIWELVGIGAGLLGASWAANIAVSGGVGGSKPEYIILGVVPIVGPWAQLPTLQWTIHPRWGGWFHPLMGVAQLAGLAMLLAGIVFPVRGEAPSASAAAPRWTFAPMPVDGGAGLSFDLRF